ncbi:MAG: rhodanese-like domain-containing protein, partial [Chloroflexi bacterium]
APVVEGRSRRTGSSAPTVARASSSGSMSAIAARTLVKLGYTDVWNLDGGMIAWKAAGYSLVDKGR